MKDGGPAFPTVTLRQYYAAKAMQGLISGGDIDSWSYQRLTEEAFSIADFMIAFEDYKNNDQPKNDH
jgi:hypothetical protein